MHRLRSVLFFLTLSQFVVFLNAAAQASQQQQPPAQTFTEKTASDLLLQLSETLEAHNQKKFLALFDLPQMKNGGIFQQQVRLFFSQTESIRVHLNLTETNIESDRATLTIDAEMDAQPINGPAFRRNQQLTLAVANTSGSWKIAEVQPRSFFSLP